MIADFERLYYVSYPREDLGGSNQLGSNPKPRKNCCFRPLSRIFLGGSNLHKLNEMRINKWIPSPLEDLGGSNKERILNYEKE